ncbi:uncharacterized protein LOC124663473 [Lolium rigidum]|uniref:uncharacterized protein LOC124663473 n=1 Tax=Lolium rigidum TaxID=89674 RepID=UPI001F5CC6FB|nr:uncharacterized protein LOC124663473 [Lolium rigidum]
MHVLWLLAARRFRRRARAVSTITASAATAPATPCSHGYGVEDDDGPFFDLDLSCCRSAPASSAGSSSESEDSSTSSSSCGAGGDADLVISLQRQRSCSASPPPYDRLSFGRCGWGGALPPQLKFCASEPSDAARLSASGRRGRLRTFSFGAASAKAAFYGGRASFSRSSSSARSARIFAAYGHDSPSPDQEQETGAKRVPPSADVIRRYLGKISRRLRRVAPAADIRLRKSRSASAAQTAAPAQFSSPPSRRDDTLLEKQDGIASAIAHCKESIHRASMSDSDSSLLRSWSDRGTEPASRRAS